MSEIITNLSPVNSMVKKEEIICVYIHASRN